MATEYQMLVDVIRRLFNENKPTIVKKGAVLPWLQVEDGQLSAWITVRRINLSPSKLDVPGSPRKGSWKRMNRLQNTLRWTSYLGFASIGKTYLFSSTVSQQASEDKAEHLTLLRDHKWYGNGATDCKWHSWDSNPNCCRRTCSCTTKQLLQQERPLGEILFLIMIVTLVMRYSEYSKVISKEVPSSDFSVVL
ncbi:hypothetical protein SRHO_G00113280 [Serrasalmus rhombeus]